MFSYEKYAQFRDAKGFNDNRVAETLNIRRSTLSEWKSGKYSPKVDKMYKIARLLDVTLEELFTEKV